MTSIIISKDHYEDIKDETICAEPFFFTESGIEWVECDVVEEHFTLVSKEKGWM